MEVTTTATPPNCPLAVRLSTEIECADEPMSPTGRVMEELSVYIVLVMGLGTPVNLSIFRAGIETELIPRFPRFRSIQVAKNGKVYWVHTTVNVDDHIVVPKLDPTAVASDPEKAVENYVASLTTWPMERLWEFHFLDFPTSEVTSTTVLRLHHSIGDGASIMMLLMASARRTPDTARLPAMPPPPRRMGAIYQQWPRPPLYSLGDYAGWVWSYFVLAWHTLVDVMLLHATLLFLRDPPTMFTRVPENGESPRHQRLVHWSLSLDDVKLIKTAVNCTINDVLLGVTSAAHSRYYFRKSGETNTKRIHLRSIILVNTRPLSSRQIGACFYRRIATRTSVLISNVVGPAEHITLCGHPVAFMAISTYGQPQVLTVHYLNYGSTMKVILAADDTQFPDCHELLDDFAKSIEIIKDAAGLKTLTTSLHIE